MVKNLFSIYKLKPFLRQFVFCEHYLIQTIILYLEFMNQVNDILKKSVLHYLMRIYT